MLSTVTLVLCFCPHSTANFLLNHSSNAGTKWLHCRILSVFCCAAARSGNRNAGPSDPAAIVPAPAILMKSLRDTPLPFFSSFIVPSSGFFSDSIFVANPTELYPRKVLMPGLHEEWLINVPHQTALRLPAHRVQPLSSRPGPSP